MRFLFLCFFMVLAAISAQGSVNVTVNGSSYTIPQTNERGWGTAVTSWIQAISANTLQPIGGTFTLTNDVDFGLNFGIKSTYFKSRSSNLSTSGILRLANTDLLGWRNGTNSADLTLGISSNKLVFNDGTAHEITTNDYTQTLTNKTYTIGTASRVLTTDVSGNISPSAVTTTTLGFLDATSSIQTQINAQVAKSTFTTKGDILQTTGASTVSRLAVGSDGQVLTADSVSAGGIKWATAATAPDSRYEISNLSIGASVAANALTINILDKSGATPSGGSIVKVGMRATTLASGLYNQRTISAALSLTVPSTATLGTQNGVAANLYVYLIDNAGTLELAISQALYTEDQLATTTAIAGGSNSATALYSTTARSAVPGRLIGRLVSTQTTAGTWAAVPTSIITGTFSQVALNPPRSEVYVDTPGATTAGWGTTNLKIRRYTNVAKNVGTAITYADSATLGASFTINEAGIYSIVMGDYKTASSTFFTPSLNATGTSNANTLTYATGKRGGTNVAAGSLQGATSWTGALAVGDVIRPHGQGDADAADSFAFFSITKVSQ